MELIKQIKESLGKFFERAGIILTGKLTTYFIKRGNSYVFVSGIEYKGKLYHSTEVEIKAAVLSEDPYEIVKKK